MKTNSRLITFAVSLITAVCSVAIYNNVVQITTQFPSVQFVIAAIVIVTINLIKFDQIDQSEPRPTFTDTDDTATNDTTNDGKLFISPQRLYSDSFDFAEKLVGAGVRPTWIVALWRGGCPIAMCLQEYFARYCPDRDPPDHIAIRTKNYDGVEHQASEVKVFNLHYLLENLGPDDEVLIVDDIFDSGRTLEAVVREIRNGTGDRCPRRLMTATLFYKTSSPGRKPNTQPPDFYYRATNSWVVFPHELEGLSGGALKRQLSAELD